MITIQDLELEIQTIEYMRIGQKTTVCLITMANGFEVVGTSACVDPNEYNAEIGERLAKDKALDKVWELEGYRAQWKGKKQ